jgi:hypothetical protein
MTEYLSVAPGVDMTNAMHLLNGGRLTKKWLREYLRTNPQKDFRILGGRWAGSYVNGEECVKQDLCLEVRDPQTLDLKGVVVFQMTTLNDWGYQAVVR